MFYNSSTPALAMGRAGR